METCLDCKHYRSYIGSVYGICLITELTVIGDLEHNVTLCEHHEVRIDKESDWDFPEAVNHPAHYNKGKIEAIDVIEDWDLNFNLGSTVKYIARADHKGNDIQDLEKARWYIDREINRRKK